MQLFTTFDLVALAWFLLAWAGYGAIVDLSPYGDRGLTAQMHAYRSIWMRNMLDRELRMIDTQIISTLQNGNAFFA